MQAAKRLGVIVWPPAIQDEGIDQVLDNLQAAGVSAVATSTYVAEPAAEADADRREPPDDGGRGLNRVIERPLWGHRSLYLRTGSSHQPDPSLFEGLKYSPPLANDLTDRHGGVIARFIDAAKRRGLKAYLITHVSHLPRLRPGLDEAERVADVPRLPNGGLPSERMVNFAALASPDVQAFFAAEIKDLLGAYPSVDGLLLDRAEQSVYTFHDAFVDFGLHARRLAHELGLDFDRISSSAQAYLDGFTGLSNDRLVRFVSSSVPVPSLDTEPALQEVLAFRSQVTTRYLEVLRQAADSIKPGVELVPVTFPPPLSLLTGANFRAYSHHADAVMIKFFTMHWPLIVTYWANAIARLNPSMEPGLLCAAISKAFDFEDGDGGKSIDDYSYPGPEEPHRAGTDAQLRKIRQASADAGDMPVFPSVHAYGPIDDVERRFRIGWEGGSNGMWVNRYGYLSDEKLKLLAQVTHR